MKNHQKSWPWRYLNNTYPEKMNDGSSWPKITIITPSYNQAKFIEETIRSVILQGYPNLEYIIYEDCSTDDSIDIIKKYESKIKLIKGDLNKGMSWGINRGFEASSGDIVTWISSDDIYMPNSFETIAYEWINNKNAGAYIGNFQFMDENSIWNPKIVKPYLPKKCPIDLSLLFPDKWRLHQVSTFYNRNSLLDVGFYVSEDLKHNMDRELIFRMAIKTEIVLIDKNLAAFRIHKRSKSWSNRNMIIMAKEFASIQNLFLTGNKVDDLIRFKIARFRIAKGYVKFAKYSKSFFSKIYGILFAISYRPSIIFDKKFIKTFIKVFFKLK